MCPFHDYDNYKYKVKLIPGIEKKGKAAKPALNRQRGNGRSRNEPKKKLKSQTSCFSDQVLTLLSRVGEALSTC